MLLGGLAEGPDEFGGTTMIASPADFHGTPGALDEWQSGDRSGFAERVLIDPESPLG